MGAEVTDKNGYKIAHLICVTGENNNKYYRMVQISESEFRATWGRVDVTEDTKVYPMSKWSSTIRDKTKESKKPKPYTDVTHLHAVVSSTNKDGKKSDSLFHSDRPDAICRFVENLLNMAKESVKRNYVISANAVTKAQVDQAQDVLNKISKLLDVDVKKDGTLKSTIDAQEINDQLLELYKVIPRKMKKVQDHLIAVTKIVSDNELKEAKLLFSNEQDALDVMAGQVNMVSDDEEDINEGEDQEHDILHTAQLDAYECSPAEIEMIKKKMGPNAHQLKSAIRVVNKKTQKDYDKFLAQSKNKKTDLLWHGSRNENWWSIFQQGLKIRPSNAVLTGAMFGNGVYFADKAQKSIGYTSLRGSYWASGGQNSAYLALYEIHQGDQLELTNWMSEHSRLDETKMKQKGKDSVFAKGGADLRNNEFITYNTAQSTIKYLIEIKS